MKKEEGRMLTLYYSFMFVITCKSCDSNLKPDACPAQKLRVMQHRKCQQCYLNHFRINLNHWFLQTEYKSGCCGGNPLIVDLRKIFLAYT